MDYTPRRLMHLSREGFKEEVLSSCTIWLCTCCYACMVECPKKINITHLMYALKTRAIQEHFYPKRFPIPELARQFPKMIRGSGRITESRLVLRVFLRVRRTSLRRRRAQRQSRGLERTVHPVHRERERVGESVPAGEVELAIEVDAPPWVDVDKVELVRAR